MEERRRRGGFYTRDVEIYITLGVDSGLGQSGDYAYKKLSKDKGMIILQKYDGLDAPNLHILLHFTTPDSGMAVYTNGEEKLIGNVMFMLETNKPQLRRKIFPKSTHSCFLI